MKPENEVQDRIRFLLTQELDRRVADARARLPHKCKHNQRQTLDVRKTIAGEPNAHYNRITPARTPNLELGGFNENPQKLPMIGLCMLGAEDPTKWNGTICEDPIDAQRCPYFDSVDTKASVQELFQTQIQDLTWLESNLPQVYGLLWTLDSGKVPALPWWKQLWFRLIRVRPDPIRTQSLPPPPSE
jgi:hypothetical protein